MVSTAYHDTRLTEDAKRDVVWQALWRFHFSHIIAPDACVLDLGCGYGSFINQVIARRRIAIDAWPDFTHHVAPAVEAHVGDVADLDFLPDVGIDFVLASNLFEHLTQPEFARVLANLRPKLSADGVLTIIQPNFRYAYREYFDDYTHITPYSHISLADFLIANGYDVLEVRPRFLPLSIKSRLPVSPWLIATYLASPLKPLGKQMLIRARPRLPNRMKW